MSTSAVETTAVGFTTRLRYAYWVVNIVLILNTAVVMCYGPVAGSVLWDEVDETRFVSWTFWWWWGQSLAFYTPILTLWLMSHNWYGAYYAIHLVGMLVAIAIHIMWAIMVIDVFVKCTPRFCDGDQNIAALNPKWGTAPDIGLWAYTGVVCVFFLCDLFYLLFNYYLHRKTEFRTQLEVAAASRAPAMARSYMYRSQYGGARWLFDAFSPPGMHAYGSFSPYTGGASRYMAAAIGDARQGNATTANAARGGLSHDAEHHAVLADQHAERPHIGADIIACHAGAPAPTLTDLYSWSPWSLLSHTTTNAIGRLFARRHPDPVAQFAASSDEAVRAIAAEAPSRITVDAALAHHSAALARHAPAYAPLTARPASHGTADLSGFATLSDTTDALQ